MTRLELSPNQKRKIQRAIKALEEVRAEIQASADNDINWYLEDTANFHLMDGHSHDTNGNSNTDMIIESFHLAHASGGGW